MLDVLEFVASVFLDKVLALFDDGLTIIIGIAGGVIGGIIGRLLGIGDVTGINLVSVILAVVGAVVLLFAYRMIKKKSA